MLNNSPWEYSPKQDFLKFSTYFLRTFRWKDFVFICTGGVVLASILMFIKCNRGKILPVIFSDYLKCLQENWWMLTLVVSVIFVIGILGRIICSSRQWSKIIEFRSDGLVIGGREFTREGAANKAKRIRKDQVSDIVYQEKMKTIVVKYKTDQTAVGLCMEVIHFFDEQIFNKAKLYFKEWPSIKERERI